MPDKNIKMLAGLPLFAYRIKTALSLCDAMHVWFSSDSEAYVKLAKQFGAIVPFIRPPELATDNANSSDVVLHAMQIAVEQGRRYKFIGLLEPTSPFVYKADISNALTELENNCDSSGIVAVKPVRPHTFFTQAKGKYLTELADKLSSLKYHNRQQFKEEVTPSGGFYISKWEEFLDNRTFYTPSTLQYMVPPECELEIDDPIDWQWAEFLVSQRIIDLNKIFNQ